MMLCDAVCVYIGDRASINDVSMASDGLSIYSCGKDGSVKHWDVEGELEMGRYHHPIQVISLASQITFN